MIVSHRHRFIFIAIPRTGSHSLRAALVPHLAEGDWQQCGRPEVHVSPLPALAEIGHGHVTASQARAALGEAIWESYFTFAFVRDPADRFISSCALKVKNREAFLVDPKPAIAEMIFRQGAMASPWFWPQADYICDESGLVSVDFVGRFEHLQADFQRVCEKLGLPPSELGREMARPRPQQLLARDRDIRRWAGALYARDINLSDHGR
ncbi:MAG TPA: hypothetical protein DIW43_12585 [Spongiibacteraceae bacterium]|nr:hypothetical protein [Spongiibacteraceae bacterium]HCS28287.1 hypothetical protein [Spongiibacteraceae bacterium]|tara:strand:- start:475 stop:1098 length:624 start_codon:yes stop_codon:yes gene_type:complete